MLAGGLGVRARHPGGRRAARIHFGSTAAVTQDADEQDRLSPSATAPIQVLPSVSSDEAGASISSDNRLLDCELRGEAAAPDQSEPPYDGGRTPGRPRARRCLARRQLIGDRPGLKMKIRG